MKKACKNTPKPLIEICGKPILCHQIEVLKKEGISDFLIVTGYLAEKIESYFGNGKKIGVNINYYRENTPLGTAGALFRMNFKNDFLFCNGDLIFDFDLNSMLSFHYKNHALATLFVHPNNHPQDSSTLVIDKENRVVEIYDKNKKPDLYPNLCNAGIQIVSPELLKMYDFTEKVDFDKNIIAPAINTGKIIGYKSAEYTQDVGTPERFKQAEKNILAGIVAQKNKKILQKAVFLDRDGTINIHKGYISNPDEIELLDGVPEAINILHELGYLVIIITNQPVVARGQCTLEDLEKIHYKLEMLLAEKGAFVDGIYYCPHHPDKGFYGENKDFKIVCNCRKPSPGMILQAKNDFNIDLSKSYMVGDNITDIETGKNAGCETVLINKTKEHTLSFDSLKTFADFLT